MRGIAHKTGQELRSLATHHYSAQRYVLCWLHWELATRERPTAAPCSCSSAHREEPLIGLVASGVALCVLCAAFPDPGASPCRSLSDAEARASGEQHASNNTIVFCVLCFRHAACAGARHTAHHTVLPSVALLPC